jgi:hypothetical protein
MCKNSTRMTRKKRIITDLIRADPFFPRHPRAIYLKIKRPSLFETAPKIILFHFVPMLFSKTLSYFIPVYHVPECGEIICAAVLVFQVISVFPNIGA